MGLCGLKGRDVSFDCTGGGLDYIGWCCSGDGMRVMECSVVRLREEMC
jgi:hypothetical protein